MTSHWKDHAAYRGNRLALPAAFIGSMFAIALLLYAIDATPLRMLVQLP